MIDTDKYEGHTEGLWCWKDGNIVRKAIGNTPLTDDAGLYLIADKHLIADAPLLLAEVKRLRRIIEDIESMIPDNHEEVSPILSDILNECHRVLPMFNEVIK